MLQIIILVLGDTEQLEQVVDAWYTAGVAGVTIMHSVGMEQLGDRGRRDDLPLFPSMRDLLERDELHHRMIFTLTNDDTLVERLIAETEKLVGNLDEAGNGILFTLPVGRVRGLRKP